PLPNRRSIVSPLSRKCLQTCWPGPAGKSARAATEGYPDSRYPFSSSTCSSQLQRMAGDMRMTDSQDARARWAAEVAEAYRAIQARLHGSLLGRLRNPQDADDAVQEVFLRFFRVPERELLGDPVKYLFGIGRNVVSEILLRRRKD